MSQETSPADPELDEIVGQEERCLQRILNHVEKKRGNPEEKKKKVDYDTQLLELRDEIAASRMEDVPPLLEQMERLQGIAARQRLLTEGHVDPRSPYFGRMVLAENERTREVLIGRSTYLDAKDGVRVVDWRDAPVSRLYYRYAEGDSYEETFGDREIEGEVLTRRSLAIVESRLRRVVAPQGTFLKPENGAWKRGGSSVKLAGGEGRATRAEQHRPPGKLGIGEEVDIGEDKHLKEITALIDPRQFELITKPDSGLVVIQGGAGSGKTTIGLHRLAYLAFQDRRRFRPDRMLVVVFNDALARYIAHVLPALDVSGVPVRTYTSWASKLRLSLIPDLPKPYCEDTPVLTTRFKKSPAMLGLIEAYASELEAETEASLTAALSKNEALASLLKAWSASSGKPLTHRTHSINRWLKSGTAALSPAERHTLERVVKQTLEKSADLVSAWTDILTGRRRIEQVFAKEAPGSFNARELERALEWCFKRCSLFLQERETAEDTEHTDKPEKDQDEYGAVDGVAIEEKASLDVEDDTLLLALWQRLRGPLLKPGSGEALIYEHILIDEAQDLSPVELKVVTGCMSKAQSVTFSGDVAQRLHMENGFTGWKDALSRLDLRHVEVEPLRVAYRSTAEIVEFSRGVLGPLADENAPEAVRTGAPVELFRFADLGEAVGFLGESLRDLIDEEPRASVAVISRHPEQAELIYRGLVRAETPKIRRVAAQDFSFKPGIDITDVRQVKGLEFDYVILVEVSDATYPSDDESRHLLHIAATRAAHQLWILASGKPSPLLPEELRERSY